MFHVEQSGVVNLVEVDSDLDIMSCQKLASAIANAACSTPERPIIVSLEHCPFCDSTGLGVLVTAKTRLGSRLHIVVAAGNRCRRVFDITGLAYYFPVYESVADALEKQAAASAATALVLGAGHIRT